MIPELISAYHSIIGLGVVVLCCGGRADLESPVNQQVWSGFGRRHLLCGLAASGAAAVMSGAPHAAARSVGRTVAVFGGGVAGLTVAHELVERGYDVTVYEPVSVGGKARSIDVPGTDASFWPDSGPHRSVDEARITAESRVPSPITWQSGESLP
ncbi:FAD-dependent oxidoreductase [Nocardia vinacea]|uniref:FAD-dependent oxidoreductase n=1 Tax=Nocardia vinacea TaxID=96468 RepID=UPI003AF383E6